jgi:transcriptional regulator with XRE-family HTH domain
MVENFQAHSSTLPRLGGMEGNPNARSIANRIRSIRLSRGWSLADVEVRSGGRVKVAALGSYERCDRALSLKRIIDLADIFGIPLNYLLGSPEKETTANLVTTLMIDLRRVRILTESSCAEQDLGFQALRIFLTRIAERRDDWNGEVMSLRRSDLETLALMTLKYETELLEWLAEHKLLVRGPGLP